MNSKLLAASGALPILAATIWACSGAAGAQSYPIQKPGDIKAPTGHWQTPGAIHTPSGPWQKPGAIQVPKGIQAIKATTSTCTRSLNVGADALFAFNQSTLNPDAEKTLSLLGPMIRKAGKHPIHIDGHTDAIGSDDYNQGLSERRARAVRNWLVAHHYVAPDTPIQGFGKRRPVAPNTKPDGADDPLGRQKNRRVEIVIETCKPA